MNEWIELNWIGLNEWNWIEGMNELNWIELNGQMNG
jgi:hypothetical protein